MTEPTEEQKVIAVAVADELIRRGQQELGRSVGGWLLKVTILLVLGGAVMVGILKVPVKMKAGG